MKRISLFAVVSFALLGAVALAIPAGPGYHLIKKIPLGAAPGGGEYFDYVTVDSAARRVYLSHGAEVKVLDADTFAVLGTISGLKRCHGVLVLPELGKGFITDGDAASVAVFDLKTLKVTEAIKSSPDTDSILYDPASKLVFTFNGDSKNATIIDPVKETVVKVIDMAGAPEQPVADGKGAIYDNNEEKNDVAVVDTQSLKVKARWPVAPAGAPVAMGMDREHRRIFSAGRDPKFLVLMDADNGRGPAVTAHQRRCRRQHLRARNSTVVCLHPRRQNPHFSRGFPEQAHRNRNGNDRIRRQNDGLRSEDAQSLSDHRRFWSGSCCNEGTTPSATKSNSWNVSGTDLWALENSC